MSDIDRGESRVMRYGIAVLSAMISVIAYMLLEGAFGSSVVSALFLPGVLASLFYGGVGPGYLAAVLSTIALIGFALFSPGQMELTNILRIVIASAGFLMACALVQGREKKIRSSMSTLSSALATIVEGIIRLDRNGRIVEVNDQFAQLVGSSDVGLLNRPMLELVLPEDRPTMMGAARQCWREGRADVDLRILWRGAAPHEIHLMLSRTDNAQGRPAGIYCFVKDISARKKELEELRQGRERLEVAFRHGVVGMTVSDVSGNWLEVNPAFCELLGYRPEELVGRHTDAVTHPDDRAKDAEIGRQLASGAIEHHVIEKRYVSRSGQTVWARVSREVVHDEGGKPAYVVAQVQEMSRE